MYVNYSWFFTWHLIALLIGILWLLTVLCSKHLNILYNVIKDKYTNECHHITLIFLQHVTYRSCVFVGYLHLFRVTMKQITIYKLRLMIYFPKSNKKEFYIG